SRPRPCETICCCAWRRTLRGGKGLTLVTRVTKSGPDRSDRHPRLTKARVAFSATSRVRTGPTHPLRTRLGRVLPIRPLVPLARKAYLQKLLMLCPGACRLDVLPSHANRQA